MSLNGSFETMAKFNYLDVLQRRVVLSLLRSPRRGLEYTYLKKIFYQHGDELRDTLNTLYEKHVISAENIIGTTDLDIKLVDKDLLKLTSNAKIQK